MERYNAKNLPILTQSAKFHFLVFLVVFAALVWNTFYLLSDMPLMSWDEARHGVSAREMIQSGTFLVNTYNGQVDYYNLKPTLSFLPMITGYKLFGFNAFGLRFFSALLTVCTVFLVMAFATMELGALKGLLTGVILTSVERFFLEHNARSGDPDALYIFFYVSSLLLILGSTKSLYRFFAAFFLAGLAFLTKSFHVLPLLASLSLLLFARFQINWKSLAKFALCCLAFAVPVFLWAIARYQHDGIDFFSKMVTYDLLSRTSNAIEGHTGSAFFYLVNLRREFKFWWIGLILLAVPAIVIRWRSRKALPFQLNTPLLSTDWNAQLLICTLINVALFSSASTKLDWYVYPIIPLLSLLLASWLVDLSSFLNAKKGYLLSVWSFLASSFVGLQIATTLQIHTNLKKTEPMVIKIQELGQQTTTLTEVYLSNRDWTQAERLAGAHSAKLKLLDSGLDGYKQSDKLDKVLLEDQK